MSALGLSSLSTKDSDTSADQDYILTAPNDGYG